MINRIVSWWVKGKKFFHKNTILVKHCNVHVEWEVCSTKRLEIKNTTWLPKLFTITTSSSKVFKKAWKNSKKQQKKNRFQNSSIFTWIVLFIDEARYSFDFCPLSSVHSDIVRPNQMWFLKFHTHPKKKKKLIPGFNFGSTWVKLIITDKFLNTLLYLFLIFNTLQKGPNLSFFSLLFIFCLFPLKSHLYSQSTLYLPNPDNKTLKFSNIHPNPPIFPLLHPKLIKLIDIGNPTHGPPSTTGWWSNYYSIPTSRCWSMGTQWWKYYSYWSW